MHGQQNIKIPLYSFPILMRLEFARRIFEKMLKYQIS